MNQDSLPCWSIYQKEKKKKRWWNLKNRTRGGRGSSLLQPV
ncbi:hypothetical protein NPIL_389771, partial [Nephila pilipes]